MHCIVKLPEKAAAVRYKTWQNYSNQYWAKRSCLNRAANSKCFKFSNFLCIVVNFDIFSLYNIHSIFNNTSYQVSQGWNKCIFVCDYCKPKLHIAILVFHYFQLLYVYTSHYASYPLQHSIYPVKKIVITNWQTVGHTLRYKNVHKNPKWPGAPSKKNQWAWQKDQSCLW